MQSQEYENYFRINQAEHDNGHVPCKNDDKKKEDKFLSDEHGIPMVGTPWRYVRDILANIPNSVIADTTKQWHTDIPEAVHILIMEKKVKPSQIWLDADSEWKRNLAIFYEINYNKNEAGLRRDVPWRDQKDDEMKKQFDVNLINYKFVDVTPNGGKVSRGQQRITNGFSYVKDGGYFGVIGTSQALLTAGQKSMYTKLARNNKIIKVFTKLDFPIGHPISGVVLQKTEPQDNQIIDIRNADNESITVNINDFVFQNSGPQKGNNYLPQAITKDSLELLKKVKDLNTDVFQFSASSSRGGINLIVFWGMANVSISPKNFRVTFNGKFDDSPDSVSHPCALDQKYPEENIRSVFQGKWFHWMLHQIFHVPPGNRPAGVSYFPKLDLSTKWTFDRLAKEIGATAKEKQIVLDWAAKQKNAIWQD